MKQLSGNFPGGRVLDGLGRTWEDSEYGCQIKRGCPVILESQINNECIFSISMSQI